MFLIYRIYLTDKSMRDVTVLLIVKILVIQIYK